MNHRAAFVTLTPTISPSLRWKGAPSRDSVFFFFFRLDTCWLCVHASSTSARKSHKINHRRVTKHQAPSLLPNLLPSWRKSPRCVCVAGAWPVAGSQERGRMLRPGQSVVIWGKGLEKHPRPGPLEGSSPAPLAPPSGHAATPP